MAAAGAAVAAGLAAGSGASDGQAARRLDHIRLTASGTGPPALVVIDMQNVFGAPSSGWFTPKFAEASAVIERMLPAFGDRVISTRFVAPAHPEGAWVTYYQEWPFALVPDTDPIYVSVVADGCAGSTDANHQRALDAMALYGPLIEITDSAGVLERVR